MSRIIIMCGIPGSGKSTFCQRHFFEYGYISKDQIRFSLLKDGDNYFSKEKEVVKQFIEKIKMYVQHDYNFVIDATHLTKSSRRKILSQLKVSPQLSANEIWCLFMKTDLNLALERNSHRTGRERVPDEVIKNMYESLEVPELNEGFDKILTIEER